MSKFLRKPMCYVIGRNGANRPALQHIVGEIGNGRTYCGVDMAGWTRWYMATQLSVLLCKRCQRLADVDVQIPAQHPHLRVVS